MADIIDPGQSSGASADRERGVLAAFANNSVAANLLMGLMLVGGLVAGFGLNAQIFPTVDPGQISITVPYPGATPTEVEEGITRRVEEAVFGIDGVDRVISRASENMGSVNVELKDFVDADKVRDDVEAAVEQIADFPPADAEEPDIVRAETLSDVMTLVVSSELTEMELRRGAELLEQELLALPNVSLVSLEGARPYEISIEVREEALRRFGLSISQVATAVRASSLNLSSGELRTDAGDLLLRTNTKRMSGKEFENIVLRSDSDGTILRLSDVAVVRDDFQSVDLINELNGRQSLLVKVQKSEAEDVLAIADQIKGLLATYQPQPGIDVGIWSDQTEILDDRLSLLIRNGMLGFALVFLFLVVMLDLRLALWVAMGVPISFLGAFLFFDFLGVSINMVSLFALIVVLGIVVDDAVVVGENISAEQEAGKSGIEGSLAGVRGVFGPVLVGVLTTMAAFAPLMFVTGTFGQILGSVPLVVITVLTMSLIEVFFILPSHLAHKGGWSRWPLDAIQGAVAKRIHHFRDELLTPFIAQCIRFRYLTVAGGIGVLFIAGLLVATGGVRFIFFPELESDSIRSTIEFPIGTPFVNTRNAAERVVAAAESVNAELGGQQFRSVSATIGGQAGGGGGPGGQRPMQIASHLASVQIQLNPEPLRTLSAQELERLWRQKVGDVPGVERLSFVASFFSSGSDVEFELAHQDDKTLELAVEDLKEFYRGTGSMYEINDSNSLGKRQYDIELTAAGEAAGLTPADVARQLRHNFFGDEVQRIQRGREELKVMVRYPEEQRRSPRDFFNVRIRLSDGSEVPLETVARVVESRSYSAINRVDGLRIVTVGGDVDIAMATPTEINARVMDEILPTLKRRYPGLQAQQSGFGREQAEDIASLGQLTLVALMVIFVLLASQLRSYVQPFVVLSGVPFGAAGALIGHYLLGYNLSFISIFGMVALSGVVVNDSLVLIDRYNKLLQTTDMSPKEAIVEAARRRFRAIFLTTATTALGLTPMLFETSTQAQFLIPMAVSLATGIVFASAVILFLVPSLAIIREDFRFNGRRRETVTAT